MKKAFAVGVLGLLLFELANVYFVMPMPGSQRMQSIDVAHALYRARWLVRALCGALVIAGVVGAWRSGRRARWWTAISLVAVGFAIFVLNFQMAADRMFRQPESLRMVPGAQNRVAPERLVVGVEVNGEARAYPVWFIGYHHQVRDTVGGQPVLVSYCTVCRTGRVFSPVVDGREETFRLVGMDHFNAMFEDRTTGSWWRQANGEAVAGPLAGKTLAEIPSLQVTLARWLALHPASLVMQADPQFTEEYPKDDAFERGTSRKKLTGTDPASWGEKSWVVGITLEGHSKAFDWNRLRRERVINDQVGGTPIVLAIAADDTSFFAYRRPSADVRFALQDNLLVAATLAYPVDGAGPSGELPRVSASQEFWHSWRTFHPGTEHD